MEIEHFESLYPENTRFEEIEKILSIIKEGNSCQVISVPGVGRSNLFGLFSYNKKVRALHLGSEQSKYHFVLLNFSEIRKRTLLDVNKFIFLGILDSLRERAMIKEYNIINEYFKESISFNDELVLFAGLKKTIDFLCIEKNLNLVLLFDRFEEYIPTLTSEFFANLRILRNRAKYHFSAVFSLNRPLEEEIEPMLFADFFEYVAEKNIYLPIMDKPGLEFRISYLEKITGKKIDKKIIDEVLSLTNGHGRLTILSLELSLTADKKTLQNKNKFIEYLLSQRPIKSSLFAIWNSLNPSEQQSLISNNNDSDFLEKYFLIKDDTIAIPLFEMFVKKLAEENKEQQVENITYDENTNKIKLGDASISDNLTSSEFKLLKYLIFQKEKIIEKEEIINAVWGDQKTTLGVTDQALDQLIFRLRKKIEKNPNEPTHIFTIKGRGVKFSN